VGWAHVAVNRHGVSLVMDVSEKAACSGDGLTEKLYCIHASDELAVLQRTCKNTLHSVNVREPLTVHLAR
jgi:hypothetical protein